MSSLCRRNFQAFVPCTRGLGRNGGAVCQPTLVRLAASSRRQDTAPSCWRGPWAQRPSCPAPCPPARGWHRRHKYLSESQATHTELLLLCRHGPSYFVVPGGSRLALLRALAPASQPGWLSGSSRDRRALSTSVCSSHRPGTEGPASRGSRSQVGLPVSSPRW